MCHNISTVGLSERKASSLEKFLFDRRGLIWSNWGKLSSPLHSSCKALSSEIYGDTISETGVGVVCV